MGREISAFTPGLGIVFEAQRTLLLRGVWLSPFGPRALRFEMEMERWLQLQKKVAGRWAQRPYTLRLALGNVGLNPLSYDRGGFLVFVGFAGGQAGALHWV